MDLNSIANIIGAAPVQNNEAINTFSIDTRNLQPGDVFVALKGPQHDGHDYIEQAFANGAIAAIVEKTSGHAQELLVPSTYKALSLIATYKREKAQTKNFIAITGSVGKTTTKEFTYALLNAAFPSFRNFKNNNNSLGVSLNLANMPMNSWVGIFEAGMDKPGEIEPLSKMIRPTIALVNEIGPNHIEAFNDQMGIVNEKASIFSGLTPNGTAIINEDALYAEVLYQKAQECGAQHILQYSLHKKSTVQGTILNYKKGKTKLLIKTPIESIEVWAPFTGHGKLRNLLAACTVAYACGLSLAPLKETMESLSSFEGRGQIHELIISGKRLTLIDDAYNSGPLSLVEAFSSMRPYYEEGRPLYGVLGDMLELGELSSYYHTDYLMPYVDIFQHLYLTGTQMGKLHEKIPKKTDVFTEKKSLVNELISTLPNNAVLLVKASNSIGLGEVVKKIISKGE